MTKTTAPSPLLVAGLAAGAALSFIFAGCASPGYARNQGYRSYQRVPNQTTVMFEDDYVYYPGYEVYYSRNRNEYVYRDGNAWVRRPEPRGVSVNMLRAAPSVQMDFRDSPDRHNASVVKSYPKSWKPPARAHDNRKSQGEKNGQPDQHGDGRNDQEGHRLN